MTGDTTNNYAKLGQAEVLVSMPKKNSVPSTEILDGLKVIVSGKTEEQKDLLKTVSKNTITFITGPAGSGKTYLTVAYGLQQLIKDYINSACN